MESKEIFEDDRWIYLNIDEKEAVKMGKLKTENEKLICRF